MKTKEPSDKLIESLLEDWYLWKQANCERYTEAEIVAFLEGLFAGYSKARKPQAEINFN